MRVAKKAKEKKSKEEKKGSARVYALAMIFTAIVYIACCFVQRIIADTEDRVKVYVASKDIEQGVFITSDNFTSYFTSDNRAVSDVPVNYISSPEQIYNSYTNKEYVKNDTLSIEGFTSEKSLISDIENPIEVSVNASNLAQVVGGIIRAGDKINIYSVDTVNVAGVKRSESVEICRGAYVTKTFTSAGVELNRDSDTDEAALIINIVISEDDEDKFNVAVANGTLRVSKVLNNNEKESNEDVKVTDEKNTSETVEEVTETLEEVEETSETEEATSSEESTDELVSETEESEEESSLEETESETGETEEEVSSALEETSKASKNKETSSDTNKQ